jgi:lactate dehydrogenase-like 2-hydroxyacid dehydrogenase
MIKPRVLITQWMPPIGVERLKERCEVDYSGNTVPLTKEKLIARAQQADAALVFVPDVIDKEVLDCCPKLRVISSFGKGFDNIDIEACTERGIQVTINPSALTDSTADLAIGLILTLSRNIVTGDFHVRHGQFSGWHATNLLGRDFHHCRLGIIGMGSIGEAIARRAIGFDVEIFYNDIQPFPAKEEQLGISYVKLPELLAMCDYIVVATNLTDDTYHLIGKQKLRWIKPGSFLINIARGSVVDEQAIVYALKSGALGGYAADVFEFEDSMNPQRPNRIPADLLARIDKTVFTPHMGTATIGARDLSSTNQLLAALQGESAGGAVNEVPLKNLLG